MGQGCPMFCRFDPLTDAVLKNTLDKNTTELFTTANDDYEQQLTTKQKRQIQKTDNIDGC